MNDKLTSHEDEHKACDQAIWLNFEHRLTHQRFGAIKGSTGKFYVVSRDHPSFYGEKFKKLPKSYRKLSYSHIQEIAMDHDPLPFWETIRGMVSTVDGETLRFILRYQIPLEKFICFELAARGYDIDNRWCGFEKAKEIWLK